MVYTSLNKLKYSYPEGFAMVPEMERSQMQFVGEPPAICLKDKDRHMILTAGAKKPGLFGGMISVKSAAEEMEKRIRKPMEPYGYHLEDFKGRMICGENASGFRYRYTAQDIGMYGESYVVRHEKVLYYLHVYLREEFAEESWPVWERILDAVEWKK